ncbi:Y-family DNA polymerase [Tahibacter amnicola]|uniref:DNA polymerase Y family protein n=1 Tax=Tahibacter amnicola TaxID=2976241 RepID=A0ABY6BG62_9GAMM|nr:DNA polymerase Y family protein [Tahibacter amnicola]UXI68754.1 DNA polymerase Y family protein [Tahibacter amnicola]
MLWACLHFFELPLAAVFATAGTAEAVTDDVASEPAQPQAVYEGPRQRPVIALANAPAQAQGVRRGQSLPAASALCAQVTLRPRDPAGERQLLDLLAAWAYGYSAQVSRFEDHSLLVEVGASLRLFGGWSSLERQLRADLQQLGYAHRMAVAPVAAAASVLARISDGVAIVHDAPLRTALRRVPLPFCGLDAKAVECLTGIGLTRLCDVLALPRAELTRRIGVDGVRWLDRLQGRAPETLPLYRPPDRFARRIELDGRVDSWPALLFPLRRLVRELALYLDLRDSSVEHFHLLLEHEQRAATQVPVTLLTARRDADGLFEFCRGRLERVSLAAEVSAISLVAEDLPPFQPRHGDLFDVRREQSLDWPDLADRLRARLGDGAVRQLAVGHDHRPELAWHYGAAGRLDPPLRGPRPLWLLRRPIVLRPDPARILAGPERIESGWWEADARRDYYIVQTRDGQRAWAFLPAGAYSGWMLHGWFA